MKKIVTSKDIIPTPGPGWATSSPIPIVEVVNKLKVNNMPVVTSANVTFIKNSSPPAPPELVTLEGKASKIIVEGKNPILEGDSKVTAAGNSVKALVMDPLRKLVVK